MIKISIIIPVYNSASCIERCLESLVNQTLKDIEIICVNDGSTDNSLEILNKYSANDNRIKVYTQNNQGPSVARNLGISKANGEYIIFVDADDYTDLKMCEDFYNKAIKTNADIVVSDFYRISNMHSALDKRVEIVHNNISDEAFKFDDEIANIIPNVPYETCCKLYKSSFLKDADIKFPSDIFIAEDCCFFINCCFKNPTISILNKGLYYYFINSQNSLSKRSDSTKELFNVFLYVKNILQTADIRNKKVFKLHFTTRISKALLWCYNSCYTISNKKENLKYIKTFKNYYKRIKNRDDETYNRIKKNINDSKMLFLTKFFEPVIEFENRQTRFVIYLFEKQILNLSKIPFRSVYYNFFYKLILMKLRFIRHFRKIRVGFWVTESSKWAQTQFFEELKNSADFDPFILLSYFKTPQGNETPKEYFMKTKETFAKLDAKIYDTFDADNFKFEDLQKFKPDIIFYQQPWLIAPEQALKENYKHSLLCYIPYCFYSMKSYVNYLSRYHGVMWKYFVESDYHKKEYEKIFKAINCETVGSVKLDNYKTVDENSLNKYWKTSNKKRIIYAPHHSFNDGIHEVATFKENGKFILELAKKYPETEWIFRPHPAFIDRLIKHSIMTMKEIEDYYKEWGTIGSISIGGNYFEIFSGSDCLITDCISFLSEYAPTAKPILHLRKQNQKEIFNDFVSKLDESYYQIYNNDELEQIFKSVIINGNDELKEQREKNKELLYPDEHASKKIMNYLKKELWINE